MQYPAMYAPATAAPILIFVAFITYFAFQHFFFYNLHFAHNQTTVFTQLVPQGYYYFLAKN